MLSWAGVVNLDARRDYKESGGEEGIRTPDRAFKPYNGLANRRLQPLGHLSGSVVVSIQGTLGARPEMATLLANLWRGKSRRKRVLAHPTSGGLGHRMRERV